MVLNSMTGFASLKGEINLGSFNIDIKSVNNRFLDINCRLPDFLRSHEFEIIQIAKSFLTRGKVDISIGFCAQRNESTENINKELACSYADAAIKLKKYLTDSDEPVSTNIDPCKILMMPGVICASEALDYEDIATALIKKLPDALRMLVETRSFEGQKLKDFLENHLSEISSCTDKIRAAMPEIISWQKNKLTELINNANLQLNDNLLEQEIIIFSQRVDIAEEINRLTSHVAQCRNILAQGGICGKKLDFLMQEFNRESNTIASKSITTEITNTAIELKVLIEQMREQVQNIE